MYEPNNATNSAIDAIGITLLFLFEARLLVQIILNSEGVLSGKRDASKRACIREEVLVIKVYNNDASCLVAICSTFCLGIWSSSFWVTSSKRGLTGVSANSIPEELMRTVSLETAWWVILLASNLLKACAVSATIVLIAS